MLPQLNRLGRTLIGRAEKLPLKLAAAGPTTRARRPTSARRSSRASTTIREFVAAKRAATDPLERLKRDRRVRALAEPFFDHKFILLYGSRRTPSTRRRAASPRRWDATLENFPAGLRGPVLSCEAKFSSVDVRNHLMTVGEYCALYLDVWSNQGWEVERRQADVPDRRADLRRAGPALAAVGPARPLQGPQLSGATNAAGLLADDGRARAREGAARRSASTRSRRSTTRSRACAARWPTSRRT